jgi:hypothetical protein
MGHQNKEIFTDPTQDVVLLECASSSHGPFGEGWVLSKSGKECLELKVWAKRICWPQFGNMPKSPVCVHGVYAAAAAVVVPAKHRTGGTARHVSIYLIKCRLFGLSTWISLP